jgi:hypothetical protein
MLCVLLSDQSVPLARQGGGTKLETSILVEAAAMLLLLLLHDPRHRTWRNLSYSLVLQAALQPALIVQSILFTLLC